MTNKAEEAAAELHRRAEGWMIALALHLRRWRETGGFAASLRALSERLRAGRMAIADRLYSPRGVFGLSRREYETASLAAQGLSNTEIPDNCSSAPTR
ncbi:hypothetical protein [Nitratidesulfovibrio sp. 1201_IL3209]|uniref:hypothetical protein n=1 Tax=Nitratidesulfovibrio sp. 1201_IL3209 TaxID=3084053 RepID=UPI002FD89BC8